MKCRQSWTTAILVGAISTTGNGHLYNVFKWIEACILVAMYFGVLSFHYGATTVALLFEGGPL